MLNVSFVWWSSCLNIYPHVSYYRRHVNYIRAARTYSIESVCRIWKTICSPFMEPLPRDSLTPQDKSVMQTSSIWRDMVKLKCNRPCSGCFVFMRLYMRTCMQCRFEFTSKVTRRQIGLLRGFLSPWSLKLIETARKTSCEVLPLLYERCISTVFLDHVLEWCWISPLGTS